MKNPRQKCFEVMLKKPLQMDQNLIFLWLFKYISVKINLIVINFHAKFCLSIKYFLGLSKISTNSLKKESCGLKFNFCSCFFFLFLFFFLIVVVIERTFRSFFFAKVSQFDTQEACNQDRIYFIWHTKKVWIKIVP